MSRLPNQKYDLKNSRLTLDYIEDYIFLNILREKLGHNASRKKIYFFLKKNSFYNEINFFRNLEWKRNQNEK